MRAALAAHGAHFEALYRADPDPWDYAASPVEAAKRRAVGAALGSGPLGAGLEIGCGAGHATVVLAPRFARLLAIDGSAEAVRLARARMGADRRVHVARASLPDGFPDGRFDAVIASEVLYYLPRPALTATLGRLRRALRPGGRLITVCALAGFSDRETGHPELMGVLGRAFGAPVTTRVGAGWRLDRFAREPGP